MSKINKLKNRILRHTAVTLVLLVSALVYISYHSGQKNLTVAVESEIKLVEDYYYGYMEHETEAMRSTLKTIIGNKDIKSALISSNREELLNLTGPLFEQLHSVHDVTHFYFTGPDRINILRVHNPKRYGDKIDRITTLEAENTRQEAWGMELGPFGTFTLRVVSPWYDGKQLIGYVELGKEVEHVMQELRNLLDVEVYAFIHKKYIQRGGWEEGIEMLGRQSDWERFLSSVNIGESMDEQPEAVSNIMAEEISPDSPNFSTVHFDGKYYQIAYIPLIDAGNLEVGHISALRDITPYVLEFHKYLLMVVATGLFIGMLLFAIIWRGMAKIGETVGETNLKDTLRV